MNKKKIFIVVFLVLGIITLLLGSAYAFYSFRSNSSNNNLSSGGMYLEYVEGDGTIELVNALPLLDGEGIVSEESITFNVNGYSDMKDTLVEYAISIVDGDVPNGYTEEDRIDDIAVKVYLEDSNKKQVYLGSPSNGEIIYKNAIKGGTKNNLINNSYTLKMWVSDSVLISDTNTLEDFPEKQILYSTDEYMTKFASIKVNIDGYNINEANAPDLPDGMIPIKYNESIRSWVKADINNLNDDWYNYYDKKWANAVMVKETSTDNTSFSSLPSEYTELEYIESTGTQWIDTGFTPNQDTRVDINLSIVGSLPTSPAGYFGARIGYRESEFAFQAVAGGALNIVYNTIVFSLDSRIVPNVPFNLDMNKNLIYFNDELLLETTYADFSPGVTMSLFGTKGLNYYGTMRLYDCKIYDNGTLVRNFIPVKNSSGVVGVYDTVNGQFYQGTGGTFVEGPQVCIGTNGYCTRTNYKDASVGTIIPESDILAYYVWVPRYKYQLFNVSNLDNTSPIEIQIDFEKGKTATGKGTTNGTWLTHPAFTLGDDELRGIWVGKFETTPNATNPTIKPDKESLRGQNVSAQFATSQKFALNADSYYLDSNTNIDSYMAKNSDWGAVAYLSHSKYGINEEIYINNSSVYYTGRSAGSVGSATTTTSANGTYTYDGKDTTTNEYLSDITPATKASTTGNITGIYDMSGGADDYVMGVAGDTSTPVKPRSGYTTQYNSGFTGMLSDGTEFKADPEVLFPIPKYYQLYGTNVTSSYLGDALGETRGWYGDYKNWVDFSHPLFLRGGYYSDGVATGAFSFSNSHGRAGSNYSFRSVLSVK